MLLATAMVVSLLTGCGSKNNSAADTTKEETQTEATAEAAADESNDTTADDAGEETSYGNRMRVKYTANWGLQIAEMIFQTRSSITGIVLYKYRL